MDLFARFQLNEYNKTFNSLIIRDCSCYEDYKILNNDLNKKTSQFEQLLFFNLRESLVCVKNKDGEVLHKHSKLKHVFKDDRNVNFLENCDCYEEYLKDLVYPKVNQDEKSGHIFKKLMKYGMKYVACLFVNNTSHHRCLPIMIGSDIDIRIRGVVDKHQATGFILNGLQILPNFLTNNLRGGHVYRPINIYKWTINEDNTKTHLLQYPCEDNVAIKSMKRTYKKRESKRGYEFNDEAITNEIEWIDVINENSPILKEDNVEDNKMTKDDYIEYFNTCIECFPKLDDLGNKMIMTPSAMFMKVIEKTIELQEQCSSLSCTSKLNTMVNGNLFYTLSSTSVTFIKSEFKTAYIPIEGHRVSVIDKFAGSLKRHVSTGVRNSEALKYPRDACNFICPINIKEMKDAGESTAMAHFVIISPKIPLGDVINVLKGLTDENKPIQIVIEGWLTRYRVTKEDVIILKRHLILATMNFNDKYLVIYNNGQLLVKYSPKYKMFVSAYEVHHTYKDAFEGYTDYSQFGSFALQFHKGLLNMPPEKSSVSLNNLKGKSCTLTTLTDLFSFLHSVGFSNSAIMSSNINDAEYVTFDDCSKFVYLNKTEDLSTTYKFAEKKILGKRKRSWDLDEESLKNRIDSVRAKKMKKSNKPYNPNNLDEEDRDFLNKRIESVCNSNAFEEEEDHEDVNEMPESVKKFFDQYEKMVEENKNVKNKNINVLGNETMEYIGMSYLDMFTCNGKQHIEYMTKMLNSNFNLENSVEHVDFEKRDENRILLYTALSNIHCDTVEDGIILDKTFCEKSPLKLFSVNLSLKVNIYDTDNEHKSKIKITTDNTIQYVRVNKKCDGFLIFGMLISDTRLKIQKRNTIIVRHCFIKNTFRYLIVMDDSLLEPPKVIDSYFESGIDKSHNKSQMVDLNASINLHYHYTTRLGHGVKISNLHGQKGIVAKVMDLSHMKFWKSDGTVVHPQLLFSKQSLVGRSTSSQTINMLNSKDLAINEFGEVTAPLSYFVHQIEANSRCKKMIPKNDLMTSENGFLSNGLVSCMHVMSSQYKLNQLLSNNKMLIDLMKINGCNLDIYTTKSNVDLYNYDYIENCKNDDSSSIHSYEHSNDSNNILNEIIVDNTESSSSHSNDSNDDKSDDESYDDDISEK